MTETAIVVNNAHIILAGLDVMPVGSFIGDQIMRLQQLGGLLTERTKLRTVQRSVDLKLLEKELCNFSLCVSGVTKTLVCETVPHSLPNA